MQDSCDSTSDAFDAFLKASSRSRKGFAGSPSRCPLDLGNRRLQTIQRRFRTIPADAEYPLPRRLYGSRMYERAQGGISWRNISIMLTGAPTPFASILRR